MEPRGFNGSPGPNVASFQSKSSNQSVNFFHPPSPSPSFPPPVFPINNSNNNSPLQLSPRPTVPPGRSSNLNSSSGDANFQTRQRPASRVPYGAPLSAERSIPARPANFQDPRRTRSPPYSDRTFDNYSQGFSGRPTISPRGRSPNLNSSFGDSNFHTHQGPSSFVSYGAPFSAERSIPASPAKFQDPRRTRSPPSSDRALDNYAQNFSGRPTVSPPGRSSNLNSSSGNSNFQTHQGPSSVVPYGAPLSADRSIPARSADFQDPRNTKSPPFSDRALGNYTQDFSGRGPRVPQRVSSPPQAFNNSSNIEDHHQSGEARRWPTQSSNFQPTNNARSPPIKYDDIWTNSNQSGGDSDSVVASPPRFGNTSILPANNFDSTIQQRPSPFSAHKKAERTGSRTLNSPVPKRNRSPPFASAEEHLPGTSYSTQDDSEREMQAKAKRLARFGVELNQPVQTTPDVVKQKFPVNRQNQASVERRKLVADQPIEAAGDFMQSDYEDLESSNVISGLCPDMCPESERQERERKGDLDRYERLDGDRNQTSKSLAVKKYNRTAEREADLIRPMPVLQQTIQYLLALLDQPYDHKFLGMYNFLWDRMRAIRMDLRMQHLFNQDAITMLEQMIRLHIIAMHELCEYTKGEGFSEGFDAHLNIEQMNKASVELFQMYDDHRKRGINVVSEKEFRGYYALLKLDKHPGYKVEPAELSLDLAKMTPEIRQTSEILFSRAVARACRTANFIAFFRLARKATYLQACLIHAHFAKLRTQALASLHSGLQNGQGIPISHIIKWLGMEEEDIEDLLEYHGFVIKVFEESYMVKEGPFLNSDKDYPTKCSRLVHSKKSKRIIKDVSSSNQLAWPIEEPQQITSDKMVQSDSLAMQLDKNKVLVDTVDEVMLTLQEDPAFKDDSPVHQIHEIPLMDQSASQLSQAAAVWDFPSPQQRSPKSTSAKMGNVWDVPSPQSPQSAVTQIGKLRKPGGEALRIDSLERTLHSNIKDVPHKPMTERSQPSERAEGSSSGLWAEGSATQIIIRPQEDETLTFHQEDEGEDIMIHEHEMKNEKDTGIDHQDAEVFVAKLKLILRKWKRLSTKQKEVREQRQLATDAALTSLPLGLPIQQIRAPSSRVRELDIDRALRERHERHQKSWSGLNTSEAVGEILSERNPEAKCLCWKLIVCSQLNVTKEDGFVQTSQTNLLASRWLHDKLMGVGENNADELVVSSQELSIWKKWVFHQYGRSSKCCVSVVREVNFNYSEDKVGGAGAVLFLLWQSISLDVQKTELHNLVMSLPSGACLPLLILCSTHKEGSLSPLMVVNGLGLHNVDHTRISCCSVVYLVEEKPPEHLDGFFSSDRLKEGLQWLASQSPIQPVVRSIKSRDLVMNHLTSSLRILENMNASLVDPNHCISVFNEALNNSAAEVTTAAKTNPSGWPCSEISLLESSNEHSIIRSLPNVGWSSTTRVEPILKGIEDCKLPFFQEDLSWLSNSLDNSDIILHHKLEFEKSLFRYLSNSSKTMDMELAATEASVLVQNGALLERRGSEVNIKPKWVAIFRRIFSWRVMSLSAVYSLPYVLEHRSSVPTSLQFAIDDSKTDASSAFHDSDMYESFPTQLTFDEMLGICYNTSQSERVHSKPEASRPLLITDGRGEEASYALTNNDNMQDEEYPPSEVVSTKTDDDYLSITSLYRRVISDDYRNREMTLADPEGAEKLSKLFEKCNVVQDNTAKTLYIFNPEHPCI